MGVLTIKKDEPCFKFIVGLILSHVAYSSTSALYNSRDLSILLNDGKCHFEGTSHTTNLELETNVKKWFLDISEDKWPEDIEFEIYQLGTKEPKMEHPWNVRKAEIFGVWQATSTFISFYEEVKPKIEEKRSINLELFNFARTVRNALAHGNKIRIDNKNTKRFKWREISYGYSDNGRKVIFNDFAFADLILLMKDVSDALISADKS